MARGQAEALVPMIGEVLAEAGVDARALDLVAVTVGPGGFTGLRIGIAAARGLALAAGVPAIGVTNFVAVARGVSMELRAGRSLVVALDSKREEIYLQTFASDGTALSPGALVPPTALARHLPDGPLAVAGDAGERLAAALGDARIARDPGCGLPDPTDVARLGAEAWGRGERAPPRPLYLRAPDTTEPRL